MSSTWSWRMPNLLQGFFSLVLLLFLPFLPESPRWLAAVNRRDESRKVLSYIYSNGDMDDTKVLIEYRNITDSLNQSTEMYSPWRIVADMVRKPSDRRRALLMLSVAIFSMWSGNNIVSYYLGTMLDQANVTDATTQLQIVSLIQIQHSDVPSISIRSKLTNVSEYHSQLLLSRRCSHWNSIGRLYWPQTSRPLVFGPINYFHFPGRRIYKALWGHD